MLSFSTIQHGLYFCFGFSTQKPITRTHFFRCSYARFKLFLLSPTDRKRWEIFLRPDFNSTSRNRDIKKIHPRKQLFFERFTAFHVRVENHACRTIARSLARSERFYTRLLASGFTRDSLMTAPELRARRPHVFNLEK